MENNVRTIEANSTATEIVIISKPLDFISMVIGKMNEVFWGRVKHGYPMKGKFSFYFIKEGMVVSTDDLNYKTFHEYRESFELGFKKDNEYNTYKKSGASSITEYNDLRSDGLLSVKELEEFNRLGLSEVYQELYELRSKPNIHPTIRERLESIKKKGQLLHYIRNNSIPNGEVLLTLIDSGFLDIHEMNQANQNGFQTLQEVQEAKKLFIKDYSDYQLLKKMGIKSIGGLQTYKSDLENAKELNFKIFELFILNKTSFPKRLKTVADYMLSYCKSHYGPQFTLSEAFLEMINAPESLVSAVKEEEDLWDISFDPVYGISVMDVEPSKVVIDASNLCWYDKNNGLSDRLLSENLIEMERTLKNYDAQDYLFIADANLPFEIDDEQVLTDLEERGKLIYSKSGQQADEVLIGYSQDMGYTIISNDTFKDWAEKGESFQRIGFRKIEDWGIELI